MKFVHKSDEELQKMNLLPEGIYDFEVLDAKERLSKAGNEMLELKLGVYDLTGSRRVVFDYLLEAMAFKLQHFAKATGLISQYESDELCDLHCIGKCGKVELIVQQGGAKDTGGYYPDKNSVKDYIVNGANVSQTSLPPKPVDNIGDSDIPF
jgi:phage-related protein